MQLDVLLFSAFAGPDVPEWVHLVPAGTFSGQDGRGPYRLDAAAVLSGFKAGDKLPIDENHAIDKAATSGQPSPARGWIVELQERDNGMWGRVDWTGSGRQLMADKAYRGISPAIRVERETGRVIGVARASLVNDPNLQLTSLHNRSHSSMDIAKLREALGLSADASEAAILAALGKQKTDLATHQAQAASIAKALGLAESATADQVVTELQSRQGDSGKLAAVKAGLKVIGLDFDKASAEQIETHLKAATAGTEVTELRRTVVELQSSLTTLQADTARKEATQFVDAAIAAGKVGLKPLRDHYIERHMKDPAAVEKEIGAMVSLHMPGRRVPAGHQAGGDTLTDSDREVCEMMGLDPVKFAETRKAEKTEAL